MRKFISLRADAHAVTPSTRFSDVPPAIDIPVSGADGEEAVEVHLAEYLDDPTELCQLLENEKAAKNLWVTIALAYAKQGQLEHAIDILKRGLTTLERAAPKDRLTLFSAVTWLQLLQSRQAPRVLPEGTLPGDGAIKTKNDFLLDAVQNINESLRINPAFPSLYLTRGVHFLLRASLIASTKTGAAAERTEALNQALKCFDDASRASQGRNMMAVMGQARVIFMQGRYAQALQRYQEVLAKMPSLTDPDPRIGLGCCLWHLGHHDRAKAAWERALALNPQSKVAQSLIGIHYLHESSKLSAATPQSAELYRTGLAKYIRPTLSLDKNYPLAAAAFANYFLLSGRLEQMEPLARTAIEKTDVNAVVSDGWYLLARKEHIKGDLDKAREYYNRADSARGGTFIPAKFGLAQLLLLRGETENAKYSLDRMSQQKIVDVRTIQGCLLAEDYFTAQKSRPADAKEKTALVELKAKAIKNLEGVRDTWKDEAAKHKVDETILLYLARLYETEQPEESLKCLKQVEQLQIDKIPPDEAPAYEEGLTDAEYANKLRAALPPQLLNNEACLFYESGMYDVARETFEIALDACVQLTKRQAAEKEAAGEGGVNAEDVDTSDADALVTTISYNLARTYEAMGNVEDAEKVYAGLLQRHPDYADASARLAFLALEKDPRGEGPKKIIALYNEEYANVEIRALMGWYWHNAKKKVSSYTEDQEYRHYKHTLQNYEKHDLYALIGMGNIILSAAREMPRNTEAERQKRSDQYKKAVEFFDKALQLDPKNAYAAQGVAIALCDDKKAYSDAVQILTRLRETIRDVSVYTNLGHVMTELGQYQRGIENYEIALSRDPLGDGHGQNPLLLACLSRAWLLKGRAEKNIVSLSRSLEYMKRALDTQPESAHLKFNVAFIQFQIAQQINTTDQAKRTVGDINDALAGLDEAIDTFEQVMQSPAPPYPKDQIQQRLNMGRNTIRKQLNNALANQQAYEDENQTKLAEAKARREAEIQLRWEAEQRRLQEEQVRREKVLEERRRVMEETERLARELRAEQVAREAAEWTEDSETGERVKRKEKKGKKGKSKRKRNDDDGFIEDDEQDRPSTRSASRPTAASGSDEDEAGGNVSETVRTPKKAKTQQQPKQKKRRLERKVDQKAGGKQFKSADRIVDSDDEADKGDGAAASPRGPVDDENSAGRKASTPASGDEDEAPVVKTAPRQRKHYIIPMPPRSPSQTFDPTPALEHDPDNFSPLNWEAAMDSSAANNAPTRAVRFSDVPVPIVARHSIATTTVPLMSSAAAAASAFGPPQQTFRMAAAPTAINMTEYIDSCRSLNEQLRQAHETERKAWNIERSALQARIVDLEFRLNRGRDSKRRSSNDSSAASAQSFRSDFRTLYDMGRPRGVRRAHSSEANHSSIPPVWQGPEATPPVTRIFSGEDSDVSHLAPISEDTEAFPPLSKEISPRTKTDGPPIDISVVDSTLEGIALKSSGPAITSSFVTKITSPQFNPVANSPSPPSTNKPHSADTTSNAPNNLSLDPNSLLDPLDKKLKLHAGHTPLAIDGTLPLSEIPTEIHTPKADIPLDEVPKVRPPLRPSENSDSYFSFVDVGGSRAEEAPIAGDAVPRAQEQPLEPEPTLEPDHSDQPLKGPLMLDPSARSSAANDFLEQVDAKLSEVAASNRFRSDTVTTQGTEPDPDPDPGTPAEEPRVREKEEKAGLGPAASTATSLDGLPKLKMRMSTNFGSAWGGDMPGRI
ncbi:hypothetical protein DV735_g1622, partial [Chaetothyriales sp. CBS 134920]